MVRDGRSVFSVTACVISTPTARSLRGLAEILYNFIWLKQVIFKVRVMYGCVDASCPIFYIAVAYFQLRVLNFSLSGFFPSYDALGIPIEGIRYHGTEIKQQAIPNTARPVEVGLDLI
ncbi:MAG: hypothetical protein GY820_22830 [Gammaproteobacteria bacterium]|nr:hypothetical protein [Gammaproteobacteria bacterium]